MNTRHYILRLLSVFVCLSVLFSHSHTVYATDDVITVNFEDFTYVDPNTPVLLSDTEEFNYTDATYYPAFKHENSTDYTWTDWVYNALNVSSGYYHWLMWQNLNYDISSGTYDIKLKLTVSEKITMTDTYFTIDFLNRESTYTVGPLSPDTFVYTAKTSTESAYYTITFKDIEIPFDIGRIKLFGHATMSSDGQFRIVPTTYEFKAIDDTKGLLGSIIELIQNIITGITELPSKIANSLKTFFDNIVNAVTNIGNLIKNAIVDLGNFLIDGIKNLFIPTEDDITAMQDKWNTLLEDRFGALYQVIDLIHDYASAFTEQSKGTITFPSVTIPLGEADFVFGGWEVKVVPDGFNIVFDTLKLIISILCTCLFANGLKNRFEKLVGGSDNI